MVTTTNTLDQQTQNAPNSLGSLGLVAGDGKLPAILARSAKAMGYRIVAFALSEDAQARVLPHADKVHLIAVGQLGRNLNLLKEEGCDRVVFIGKIPKLSLLNNIWKFDWLAVKELSKLQDFSDDSIQQAMGNFTASNNITVLSQAQFLRELFPDFGVLTSRYQPSAAEYADVEYGKRVATEIARLNIGQTVIVKDQIIVAIEAVEGTDEAIRRAVALAKGPVVVVKVAKPGHDQRFDTPAVGLNTLRAMVASKPGGVLAVAAHQTMIVEREEMIAFCDEHGMSMIAI